MREGAHFRTRSWLAPLSWLYWAGTGLRNALFDAGWLRERSFDVPIINVGNITVGGTGKTPHVEYLVRLLSPHFQVAVLSRGYKRRSRGYVLATPHTPMPLLGDEPWQMKQKFPHIHVAVDANRCRGIARLLVDEATRNTQVVLLDDAFQHRYVKPGLNILLTSFQRFLTLDCLLPAGRLRESAKGRRRAHMVVVSKCPSDISPADCQDMISALSPQPGQAVFFSSYTYGPLRPLFGGAQIPLEQLAETSVLLVTGIAHPQQMQADVKPLVSALTCLAFADHHYFTAADLAAVESAFEALPNPKLIITTEKDATRLATCPHLSATMGQHLYALPIEVQIKRNEASDFNGIITHYVQDHPRNRKLA